MSITTSAPVSFLIVGASVLMYIFQVKCTARPLRRSLSFHYPWLFVVVVLDAEECVVYPVG